MMWLKVISLFVLVQIIRSQTYDVLAKDECFRKVYVCGDYRSSVTGGTGRLATEPHRFSEICRKHKEFIACVELAADFCSGQLTNISRMILDNRRSLKLFCTDFEWKRNYFSSAKCINDNEKAIAEECLKEEEEYKDDRPYWCLIPEPCEALERVFFCTVRKMKQKCGAVAAEVHRRMHILKMENRDVVCEIRKNNPFYCRYRRQRPSHTESVKRVGALSIELSKAINNIFEASLVNTMDHFALLLNEENLSNVFDSDEYQLRQSIFKTQVEDKFGPFFKKCKLPKGEMTWKPDLSTRRFMLLFRNISKIFSEASSESSRLGLTFYENILKSCGKDTLFLASCIEKLNELGVLTPMSPLAEVFEELNTDLKSLYSYIIDLFEFLSCKDNFLVNSIGEDAAVMSWDNMDSFPLQTLSCDWKNENVKIFQCSFKLKPSISAHEEIKPEMDSEFTIKGGNVNEFLRPYIHESSLFRDSGSGSGMIGETLVPTDEEDMFDSSNTDTSELDVMDIHRSGEQIVQPEENDPDYLKEESEDIELKLPESKKLNELRKRKKQNFMEESYIIVNPVATDPVYLVDETTSTSEEPYSNSFESSPLHAYPEPSSVDEETILERDNVEQKLREIVSALNERFSSVEVKMFDSKDGSKSYSGEEQMENRESSSDNMNQSFSRELENYLKDKTNAYISKHFQLIDSKSPVTESNLRGDRTRREVVHERQNSKLDRSFNVESSNESLRINSRFMNFKADL